VSSHPPSLPAAAGGKKENWKALERSGLRIARNPILWYDTRKIVGNEGATRQSFLAERVRGW
jgi:hypothetical protein